MNKWLSTFASILTPLAGFAIGVWRTVIWFQGLMVGKTRWGDDQNINDLSILLASLIVFLLLLPPVLRGGITKRRSPLRFAALFYWVLYITTALVLLLGVAGIIIDLLGLVQGDILRSPDSLVRKLFLLTLCVAALSFASDRSNIPPLEALNGVTFLSRDQVYDFLRTLTSSMSAERTVMVTSFERLHQHYLGESEICKRWMSKWMDAVQRKRIPVLHLLRIFNEGNLVNDLQERLTKYADSPDYEMRILLAPPILPIVDLYYESGRYALLCFPKDPLRQYLTEQFLILSEPKALLVIEQWFMSMWNHGLVVKEPSGDSAGLSEARRKLAEITECDANILEMAPQLVITGARVAPEALSLLAELSKLADVGILKTQWGTAIRERLSSILQDVRNFTAGSYQHYSSISEALIRAFEDAHSTVQCTSVISETDRFWTEKRDTLLRLAEVSCRKQIRIERIFVFPNDTLRREYLKLMKDQISDRTTVFYTVAMDPRIDFALVDNRFVVIDNLLSAVRSAIPVDIQRFSKEFATLRVRAKRVEI